MGHNPFVVEDILTNKQLLLYIPYDNNDLTCLSFQSVFLYQLQLHSQCEHTIYVAMQLYNYNILWI